MFSYCAFDLLSMRIFLIAFNGNISGMETPIRAVIGMKSMVNSWLN